MNFNLLATLQFVVYMKKEIYTMKNKRLIIIGIVLVIVLITLICIIEKG